MAKVIWLTTASPAPELRRSTTDSGISFAENIPPPHPHHRRRSSGSYENDPGPMPGDMSAFVHDGYISMSGSIFHGESFSWNHI